VVHFAKRWRAYGNIESGTTVLFAKALFYQALFLSPGRSVNITGKDEEVSGKCIS